MRLAIALLSALQVLLSMVEMLLLPSLTTLHHIDYTGLCSMLPVHRVVPLCRVQCWASLVSHPSCIAHFTCGRHFDCVKLFMFAGFGATARHLLTSGLEGALDADVFSKRALQLLQPHSPAISIPAAMQQSMALGQARV